MKKLLIMALIALCYTSCSNASNQVASTDSSNVESETPKAQDTAADVLALTDKGLGPITLGMNAADVPASITGLYDRTAREMACDDEMIACYLNDNTMLTLDLSEDDVVTCITVSSDANVQIQTSNGESSICL